MLRIVLGVLAGYAVIALFIMVAFTLLWLGVGQERAFHAGTTAVTWKWLAASLPLNFLAAAAGGWVAARVALHRPHSAVLGLIGVLVILGGWAALSQATGVQGDAPPAGPPPGGLGPMEAARLASQPLWVAWVLPVLGAVGAWFGGSIRMLQASRSPR
ncbi:MAG: hypothetical protein EA350_11545 [Gemmatimonadales bacterium]|nr:MAG: hypothetical protein EA350_11545 [Gemmatimonadales bacterium]